MRTFKGLRGPVPPTTAQRAAAVVRQLAASEGNVLSRRQLVRSGVPRWYLRNELDRRRWQQHGRQVIVLHNGPLDVDTRRRVAALVAGPRAALDGVTALQAAGLTGLTDDLIEVSAPKGSKPGRMADVKVRETRWFRGADVIVLNGARLMRPAVAAVHAALWARSDRQAKLFLIMVVQQRLASVDQLEEVLARKVRLVRRLVLQALLVDLRDGSQSLGELDVVSALRARGLPVPDQQVVRCRPNGKQYLDCVWTDLGLVLEIDGIGHLAALQALSDFQRDLQLVAEGSRVVRLSLFAWALDREAVLDALEGLFASHGWSRQAA